MAVTKKILYIIGDSLCCSRPDEQISLRDLYCYKLQDKFNGDLIVIDRSSPSNTTSTSLSNSRILNDLSSTKVDFLLVHLGIVDCFPRTFYELYYQFFSLLESVRYTKSIALKIKKYFARRRNSPSLKSKPFVCLNSFKSNLKNLIFCAQNNNQILKVLIVNIPPPGGFLIQKCPNIEKIISDYNLALKELCLETGAFLLDCERHSIHEYLTDDGHHLQKQAHNRIYEVLSEYFVMNLKVHNMPGSTENFLKDS